MSILTTLTNIVEQTKLEIQRDLSSKGIDNKGAASKSLRVEGQETNTMVNVKLIGVDYIEYLDRGRGPGKFPPVSAIEDWVNTKPVEINPYLVGRKIALFGTSIYRDRTKGIMLDEKIEVLKQRIKEQIPKAIRTEITNNLKRK